MGSMQTYLITTIIFIISIAIAYTCGKKKRTTPKKGLVIWMTGLSGSGKSTLSLALKQVLESKGERVELLDGDVIRQYFPNIGFTHEARDEHIRRVGFLASRLESYGSIVIGALISPYKESRDFVRSLCPRFVEIHVSTSIEVCEARDVKGLYDRVRKGEIKQFTGIDDPYDLPENPDITLDTDKLTVDESIQLIMKYLNTMEVNHGGEKK
ncbi:MAG: adenylylsulfate kinase [Candidatus Omnitrophota bacterium]|jgi:adenylylsulfate kinase